MQKKRSTALIGLTAPLAAHASTVATFSRRSGVDTFSMNPLMKAALLMISLA
jgi:hypothetical protein